MTGRFDRLAKPYRWLEYITFGRALERCRFRFLDELTAARNALVLGDGDGRFAAQLLLRAPSCKVQAVDESPAMLHALQTRCAASNRVTTHCADLAHDLPSAVCAESFDLVATHFFLDCLTTDEVDLLVDRVRPLLQPGSRWVVSEFDIPAGAMRTPAMLIIHGLYAAFRVLAGLRTQRLPDYRAMMRTHGFVCLSRVPALGGLLVSEMWTLNDSPARQGRAIRMDSE